MVGIVESRARGRCDCAADTAGLRVRDIHGAAVGTGHAVSISCVPLDAADRALARALAAGRTTLARTQREHDEHTLERTDADDLSPTQCEIGSLPAPMHPNANQTACDAVGS
jgi:hypothetical protein